MKYEGQFWNRSPCSVFRIRVRNLWWGYCCCCCYTLHHTAYRLSTHLANHKLHFSWADLLLIASEWTRYSSPWHAEFLSSRAHHSVPSLVIHSSVCHQIKIPKVNTILRVENHHWEVKGRLDSSPAVVVSMKGNISGNRETLRTFILTAIVAQNATYTLARWVQAWTT